MGSRACRGVNHTCKHVWLLVNCHTLLCYIITCAVWWCFLCYLIVSHYNFVVFSMLYSTVSCFTVLLFCNVSCVIHITLRYFEMCLKWIIMCCIMLLNYVALYHAPLIPKHITNTCNQLTWLSVKYSQQALSFHKFFFSKLVNVFEICVFTKLS